jgi:hypothetical protein
MIVVLALAAVVGCSAERDPGDLFAPNEVGTIVVDGALIVGRPFPAIWISRTTRPDQFNSFLAAERDATVRIRDERGGELVYAMSNPGRYVPVGLPLLVMPETRHELVVQTTEGEVVTAVTTTPPAFQVDEWVLLDDDGAHVRQRLRTFAELGDSVYYAPENQLVYSDGLLEARFTRDDVPAYQVGIFSIDLDSDFVIDPKFFEEEDFEDLERNISSPPLEALDGFVRLPWFAIFFQERYKLRVYQLDENWFDLVRSLPEETGGFGFGGNFGDNFDRPIFNVDGGIGLFGSASVDSIGFFMLPRP